MSRNPQRVIRVVVCGTIAANLENGLPIFCTLFDYCVDQTRSDLHSC